jgi:hypothetical protein
MRAQQEEQLWKQKSSIQWLKAREKNTKFFHRSMLQRRNHNKITSLKDKEGNKILKHEEIQAEPI